MASRGPICNDVVERKMRKRHEDDYKRRLKNVKGQLDLSPPKDVMHVQLQVNRLQVEQVRQAEIDRQNLVIVDKLTEIKQSQGIVDHWNKDWKPSNDRLRRFRDRRQRRIDQENRTMAERLKNMDSYYNPNEWEKDYQSHLYYLAMLENSTKDYDTVEYKDRDDYGDFESSDEEDRDTLPPVPPGTPEKQKKGGGRSSEEDNLSLPPIEDKKSKGKKDEKKKGYSEHEAIMDAEELKTAIEENDKENIQEILGRTSEKAKLKKLGDKYKEMYNKDLMEDLKSALDEEVLEALKSLASAAADEDAKMLYEATKGLGTDEDIIIEILCTRNNKELAAIKKAYKKKYERTLEEDLRGDTSGDVETLLVELSKGQRDESKEADKNMAKTDAKDLTEAGVTNWGTDESIFIRVFTQRSFPQLAAMFPEYKKLAKADIAESIDSEMDGDLQKAFLALVKYSRNPAAAQEDKLSKALEDGDLTAVGRIILPMNKAQLAQSSSSYKKANKRELADDIEKIKGGDLKDLLLAKLGKGKKSQQDKGKKEGSKGKGKEAEKFTSTGGEKGAAKGQKTDKPQDKKTDKNTEKIKDKENKKQQEDTSKQDADDLHQAIEDGNKDAIIEILAKNCSEKTKLQKLQDKYKEDHKKDLLEALQPHLDEDVKDPVDSMFTPSSEYDAKCLYEAMKGIGTDEDLLIEILCTRSNDELADVKKAYSAKYGTNLEDDVKGDTSGDFEDLLVELLKGKRGESSKVDKALAKKDAVALQQAGVKSFGTDEDKFVEILTQRSLVQLNATFAEFKKITKVEIEESIEKEMSDDLQKGLLALVKCIRNASGFRTDKLQRTLKDGDTNTAARIILTSDKAELTEMMTAYKDSNKTNLEDDIDKKCSPNLKKLLLAKMGKGKKKQGQKGKADGKGKDSRSKGQSPAKGATGKADPKQQGKKQGDAAQGKEDDCSQLRKAIEAEDKKKIKEIVARTAIDKAKLKKLAQEYKKQHSQDLIEELDGKLDEDILEAVSSILLPPNLADVRILYYAMKGTGTKEGPLIEILCTRNNAEIASIKKEYQKKYGSSLEKDVKGETSGDFEVLLVTLMKGQRDESTTVSEDQAHKDAESLIEAGIKKWGTDENKFIEIFTTRSIPQLQAMLPEYTKWAKCDIEDSINNEMEGELRDGLLVLIKCVRDANTMYANKLHTALQDGDTITVARIIAGTVEAKLPVIETAYNSSYKPKLYFEVEKKCSNELKKILLPKLKDKTQDKGSKSQKGGTKKQPGAGKDQAKADGAKNKKDENQDDCTQLQNALQKKDKKKTTEIVVRNATDKSKLKKLADEYKKRHEKELVEELDGKLEDDILEVVSILLLPATQADVRTLYYAMKGIGTRETQLIEILSTRSNAEIAAIKEEYNKKYGRSLTKDVKAETAGDFEDLLMVLMKGTRNESTKIKNEAVSKDAAALMEAGVKKWGTDEDKFIEIMTQRSTAHLQAVMSEYKKLSGVDLVDTIKDEMDGDLQDGLVMLISCTQDSSKMHADKLYAALQDGDTTTVARIITGAEEGTMSDIESAYNASYKPKAYFEVDKKCSADLKKIILSKLKDKTQDKGKQKQKTASKKQSTGAKTEEKKPQQAKKQSDAAKNKKEEKLDELTQLRNAIDKKDKNKATEIVVGNATDTSKLKKLADEYKKRYEKDLIEESDGILDEDIHEAVSALLLAPNLVDVRTLYYAMKGTGTKETKLIEILCTRSNSDIATIKEEYNKKYGRSLVKDVKAETSGDIENLMTELLKGTRDESTKIQDEAVSKDAAALMEAGVKKWGTDEDKFIEIMTQRSTAHLQAVMSEYKKLSGVDLVDTIKDEMDGDLQDGLVMLISCTQDSSKMHADKLYAALQDGDTTTVARIIAGTEEAALSAIESAYNVSYKPKAYFEIDKKCSAELKKIILPKLKDQSEEKEKEKKASTEGQFTRKPSVKRANDKGREPSASKDSSESSDQKNDKEKTKDRPKLDVKKIEYRGTVDPAKDFDAAHDADALRKAMKGFGSDERAIIAVLESCNSTQRQEIAASFKQQFDKDLLEELKSELSGTFEDAIVALMSPSDVYAANALYSAMKGLGTQENVLIEVICSHSAEEIQAIKKTYQKVHGDDLIEAVKSETGGDFQALLLALLDARRVSSENVNDDIAYRDAERLCEAGETKWGTDESIFISILTTRSEMQLRATFEAYKHLAKCDILESVDEELSGDFHDAVEAIVRCIRNPPLFFAESLNSALTGVMTDSTAVSRTIITRSEVDLVEIKAAYKDKFGKSLNEEVKESLKGDHEALLLKLLGE